MEINIKDKTVTVTVKTPAGHAHEFAFKNTARVAKVIREVTDFFVEQHQLVDGDYGLTVIRDGRAEELAPGARLDDYEITDCDTLALIVKGPQVDGDFALAA
jgi:hypothetical protein